MGRRNRNRIMGLEDANGRWVTNEEELLSIASGYFSQLFSASDAGGDERVLGLVE